MKKNFDVKMPGVMELGKKDLKKVEGGLLPKQWRGEDYNVVMGVLFGHIYDIGYLIGRV